MSENGDKVTVDGYMTIDSVMDVTLHRAERLNPPTTPGLYYVNLGDGVTAVCVEKMHSGELAFWRFGTEMETYLTEEIGARWYGPVPEVRS